MGRADPQHSMSFASRVDPALSLQRRAEALAAGLMPLLVRAPLGAQHAGPGLHGRRRTGLGEAFWQFRRYAPGDSARAIDWRRSARGDALFVRETEQESAQTVWLWCDASGSMGYRGTRAEETKHRRARLVLLALALLLRRAGEGVRMLDSPAMSWTQMAQDQDMDKGQADHFPHIDALPRRSILVLATDALQIPDFWADLAHRLHQRGARVVLWRVRDRDEIDFPFSGCLEMNGLEGEGHYVLPSAQDMRAAYGAALATHDARLDAIAHAAHWSLATHVTDQPAADALVALAQILGSRLDPALVPARMGA
ncbi:MAG: DUF58 domain-containing protein [Alphaproteobacteria bacterium]|nr:MAG: DUF58 domain-containing protein [Alphaproteobacteria bacterium]